jgi:glycosyltransferase involved in cell wall biosynthesis
MPVCTPRVSVCVPAYRAAPFIGATIESVLRQTCDSWELVIVDDASPDDTYAVAEGYASDARVRLERNDRNLGPAGNWNRAVAMARCEYVKVLCDDDLLYPTCLARQVVALEAHPSAGLVGSRRDIVDQDGRVVIRGRGLAGMEGLVPGRQALKRMLETATTPLGEPSVVLFRAEALREAGPFRDRYATLVDVDMYARILRDWDAVAIDDTLAAFRMSVGSWSDRSHRVQGRNLRRLIDDVAGDVSFGLGRATRWRGRAWSYVRAPTRGLVFQLAESRALRTRRQIRR